MPAVPAVPVVVGRAATITAAQKSGVWAFFAAHDAVRWNKLVKKERIQELMAMDAYRNLKVSQISRQLEGFVVSAQLREQVGSRMYVYTDTVLEVVDGMEPDPATAAALPFAEDHMLLILSELFLFLHHVGIPCFMPDMFLQFLRDCHAELVRRNNLPAGDDDLGTDPVLQQHLDVRVTAAHEHGAFVDTIDAIADLEHHKRVRQLGAGLHRRRSGDTFLTPSFLLTCVYIFPLVPRGWRLLSASRARWAVECGKKKPHLGFFDSKKPHWGFFYYPEWGFLAGIKKPHWGFLKNPTAAASGSDVGKNPTCGVF